MKTSRAEVFFVRIQTVAAIIIEISKLVEGKHYLFSFVIFCEVLEADLLLPLTGPRQVVVKNPSCVWLQDLFWI